MRSHGDGVNRTRALLIATGVPLLIVVLVLLSAALRGREHGTSPGRAPAAPFVPAGAQRIDVGSGARGAAIFRPRDHVASAPVVVFLHGWAAVDPAFYGSWITHLVQGGATVVYPAYQQAPFSDVIRPLANALDGLRAAFAEIHVPRGRLVVVGHSAGGALAADYAASARAAGLPEPAAVFSVYPGRTLPGAGVRLRTVDADRIPASTRLLILAGAADKLVGARVARQIARTATHARTTLRIVRDPLADDHAAPARATAASRRAFWEPLDRLLAQAR